MLHVAPQDPESPDAVALIEHLSEILAAITGDTGQSSFSADDVREARSMFAVARTTEGVAVGCGAFRPLRGDIAEIKRMYAKPGTQGVGTTILNYLEAQAVEAGYQQVWLATRRVNSRAVAFYLKNGYSEIAAYGKYVGRPESICLGKSLSERC